ncbi:hypothetical protein LCGC14_1167940 [marine sediment metagenome]|uniref:Peptidase A24A N-terminal domain-containing protein n=1 Tax=marine sediment metagenome TaxID=412755 RepID=A0A0F9MDM8_9ZZZZ
MIGFILFLYGLIVGSFINVGAYRIPKKRSIVSPGSCCPNCNEPIKFYDNIPLLSYLILRGKCRNCNEPISLRYPAVELISGLLFVATYMAIGFEFKLIPALVLVSLLLLVFLIDFDHQIIPNGLVIFGLVAGAIFLGLSFLFKGFPILETDFHPVLSALGSGIGGGLALIAIAFLGELMFKKEAMGGGDIKLAVVLGMFLGPYVFLSLFLSFFVGAFISVILMSGRLVKKGQQIAFGPFMAIAAVITIYFGPGILDWYLAFI